MIILRINGERFELTPDDILTGAVENLASGEVLAQSEESFDAAVDAVLGKGTAARITRGRRLDIFDRITLAAFICREYFNGS